MFVELDDEKDASLSCSWVDGGGTDDAGPGADTDADVMFSAIGLVGFPVTPTAIGADVGTFVGCLKYGPYGNASSFSYG